MTGAPHSRNRERHAGVLFAVFLTAAFPLFGRGRQEAPPREALNTEFILCITAFDVSALPPAQRALGPILQRELAWDLERIHHRIRGGEERSRYEELAFAAATREAAVRLAKKRAERDALLYQGLPRWKYRKELRRIDTELEDLETAWLRTAAERPLIAEAPRFKLISANSGNAGTFPEAPPRGGEEAFLKATQADALLTGRFRMAYGRIFAEFRLFARGASFVHEDSTIFSSEDLQAASDELKLRFLAALVNSEPVRLTVNAGPENARIVVNGRSAKSGETVTMPPGPVTVSLSADDHQSVVREWEGRDGEETELSVILKPFTMEHLRIVLPGADASVYLGARYMGGRAVEDKAAESAPDETVKTETETAETGTGIAGTEEAETETAEITGDPDGPAEGTEETPVELAADTPEETPAETQAGFFSIYVPAGQYRYIRVDTPGGLTGEAIVRGNDPADEIRVVRLEPRRLPGKDDKPVEVKRRKFYGAYGRFWIALPLAFFINGISQSYAYSYNSSGGSQTMYDRANTAYYVSIGAWAAAGIFLAESLIRMGIYIHTATEESIPLWE